ncbi:hypothetical protein ACG9WQ_003105, partial [Acinetobacter variabilis]
YGIRSTTYPNYALNLAQLGALCISNLCATKPNRTSDIYSLAQISDSSDFSVKEAKEWSLKYGLDCWLFQKTNSLRCYGNSNYNKSLGVFFKHMGGDWIFAESWEPMYGSIYVKWRIDKRNLHHWREVDAKIWQLIDNWNVSPLDKKNNN